MIGVILSNLKTKFRYEQRSDFQIIINEDGSGLVKTRSKVLYSFESLDKLILDFGEHKC